MDEEDLMIYRPLGVLCITLHLAGCVTWQLSSVSARDLIEQEQPDEVRLTRVGGERFEVDAPRLLADSITGMSGGEPTSVPLSDLQRMEVRRFSIGRTILALVPLMLLASLCSDYQGSC